MLGVDDDKTPVGYQPPTHDLQSHLGQLLRNELDPVPPFIAGVRGLGEVSIGIVRVFESDEVHVIVKSIRRDLRTRCRRQASCRRSPDDPRTSASRSASPGTGTIRLVSQPLVNDALNPPDAGGVVNWLAARPAHTFRAVVRIAPLTVTPQLADWPMSQLAAEECAAATAKLVVGDGPGDTSKPCLWNRVAEGWLEPPNAQAAYSNAKLRPSSRTRLGSWERR